MRLTDGVIFTPSLKVAETYDDNFRAVNRSVHKDKRSSWITTLAPTFQLNADGRKSAYQLKYTASSDTFHSSHSDNNVDHHLTGDAGFEFNSRNRLLLNAGYHKVEETASVDQYIENDKYNTKDVGAVYTFGAKTARTQVEVGTKYDELRYSNSNRLNNNKERDAAGLHSTVFYAISPKTKVLLEGRYTDYDYKSFSARDSKNKGLLAGVTWDATAKTSGSFKLGREKKDFKKSVYDDKSTGMWEAEIVWEPLTYSSFTLNTRRGFDEGEDNASSIKTQKTSLGWKHYWLDRVYTEASYARTDKKYQEIKREDNLDNYGLSLTYQARRWLDIGVGYTYADNASDLKNETYTRNIYALTFNASL
ncbi:MAG TPA: outer membrane beta-barrel protein [Gammaproteobacteria bacterium]|nr:outer membrane beta-barrel protein [Gammaproteobacteria bacterium]